MGSGTNPRPHLITWDYRAGYRASRHCVADTAHFLLSVSHQARKRAGITHPGPFWALKSTHLTPRLRSRSGHQSPQRPHRSRQHYPATYVPSQAVFSRLIPRVASASLRYRGLATLRISHITIRDHATSGTKKTIRYYSVIVCIYPSVSRGVVVRAGEQWLPAAASGSRENRVSADAPCREIARRIWLMRRIRYPRGAHFLHISRILRVNPAARPAAGAAGAGVTSPGGNGRCPVRGQSRILASMARRRGWLALSHSGPPFPGVTAHDPAASAPAGPSWCAWARRVGRGRVPARQGAEELDSQTSRLARAFRIWDSSGFRGSPPTITPTRETGVAPGAPPPRASHHRGPKLPLGRLFRPTMTNGRCAVSSSSAE